MPKRIYNAAQRAAQKLVEDTYRDLRDSRAALKREIEAEFESRLEAKRQLLSRRANEAIALGVTKTDIKAAIHNGNWNSLKDLLSLTAHEFDGTVDIPEPYEIVYVTTEGAGEFKSVVAHVEDGPRCYAAVQVVGRSHVDTFDVDGNDDEVPSSKLRFKLPLDATAPEWLKWLYEQDEWKERF